MSIGVKDVMIKNVITIGAMSTVRRAVELMDKYEIGCLVIVHKDKPVGIVTERDVLTRVLLELRNPRKTRARITDVVRSSAYFEHVISSFIQIKCAKCEWRQPEGKTVVLQSSG